MVKTVSSDAPVRQRILDAAFKLFYRQGYRATGINQIISESSVAKASFYSHFPSKDDLLYEYLRHAADSDLKDLRDWVDQHESPRDRFFAPLRMLLDWFKASDFRGCPFQNILAEGPHGDTRIADIAREHAERVRDLLKGLADGLIRHESALAHLDAENLARTYLLILEGTIAIAVVYRQTWPVERAITTLESCLRR
ncbi:MAG: TetR/AcrR family transcriptional regulator [Phycisphaeraceae bacterium]|nr:TetR/AcrR family transcriptional regulator [Phycisphaeraceae bacterium]